MIGMAVVLDECDGIGLWCPFRIQNQVLGYRITCKVPEIGESRICVLPTEGMASLGRCCRSSDRSSPRDRPDRQDLVGVEDDANIRVGFIRSLEITSHETGEDDHAREYHVAQ